MKRLQLNPNNKYFPVALRFVVLLSSIAIYLFVSIILLPSSAIGIKNTIKSLNQLSQINNASWNIFLLSSLLVTICRFAFSAFLVFSLSFLVLYISHNKYWKRLTLDNFSEALRTIPATAWAYPIAIFPFLMIKTNAALYIATVLSTAPILTLSLLKQTNSVLNTTSFRLALFNGIDQKFILRRCFFPWLGKKVLVQIKTVLSLIFIIVIVLEDVLRGGSIETGLGSLIGDLRSFEGFAAMLFMFFILTFISISISSIIDIVNLAVKDTTE